MIVDMWYRHLFKTGTWRVIAFITLGIISYWATGSLALAGSIAVMDWIIKSALYFAHELAWNKINVGRRLTNRKNGCIVWFTGLSGSGKTTIADAVAEKLRARLIPVARLDGDVARKTFSSDLGFSSEDRVENCKRAAIVASYLKESQIVLAAFISPERSMRDYVRKLCGESTIIVHVDCPIEECARRDPKGMYAQLVDGEFKGVPFTGVHPDAPYEEPSILFNDADYRFPTDKFSLEVCVNNIIKILEYRGFL